MNVLARFLLALFGAVWVAACAGLAVMAWNDDEKLDVSVEDFNLQAFIDADDAERWIFTVALALVALFGALALFLAFRPSRPDVARGAVRLRQADGGTVEVTADALERLLSEELVQLNDVRAADAAVRLRGNTVTTDLTLTVSPEARIADVTTLVGQRVTEVFRDQVGVTDVRRPLVRLAYEGGGPVAPRPSAPPQAELPPPPQEPENEESRSGDD